MNRATLVISILYNHPLFPQREMSYPLITRMIRVIHTDTRASSRGIIYLRVTSTDAMIVIAPVLWIIAVDLGIWVTDLSLSLSSSRIG